MKIAYILPALLNRGPIKVVHALVQELGKYHDIDIYYFKEPQELQFDVATKKLTFLQTIDFDHYDIIHTHGVVPDIYVWWHRKKIKKAKTVTTLHNVAHEDFKYQYNFIKAKLMLSLWNLVTSNHDIVVVLSIYAKKEYLKYWKNKNIEVIHNGISKEFEKSMIYDKKIVALKKNYILLGAIGLLTKVKGLEQIIKSLVFLSHHSLVIIGDGIQMQELKNLSLSLNVQDRVYFAGFQDDVESYMKQIDIVVVPSRSEGFSLVVLEAMRMKKQIVVSDIELFKELFDVDSFVLDDTSSLVEAISSLKKEDNTYAYEQFLSRYTSEIMAKNYENLYSKGKECL